MERSSNKKNKKKPQLVIQTGDNSVQKKGFKRKPLHRNEVQIKPLMSAKNRHELKNTFQFPQQAIVSQTPFNIMVKQQNKLRALQRLQTQKTQLMKSLQILKQGAVCAIVQKQQQILKLKQHIYVSSVSSLKNIEQQQEQKLSNKINQKQLQLKQIYRKQLQDQVQQLRKQLRKQRIRYQSQLYQKQQIINSLCVQLNQSYHKIQHLEQQDLILNEKIKNTELQNISLLKQLQTSQILSTSQQLNTFFFLNISNVTHKSRIKSLTSQDPFFQEGQNFTDLSCASTIPIKKYSQIMLLNQQQDHLSNSFISQRIQSIKEKHSKQVAQIKQHYQHEINRLKKMYSNQQNIEKQEKQRKNSDYMLNMKRMSSVQSFQSVDNSHRNHQQNKKLSKYKTNSYSNLSRAQLKHLSAQGIHIQQKMQSIIERGQYDQAGTPRYHLSLKEQILQQEMYPISSNQNYDTVTTVSNLQNYFNNKNSSQKNLLNYDTLSQFTANHFEYPMNMIEKNEKLFLRTNSFATFEGQTDQMLTRGTKKLGSFEDKLGHYKFKDEVLQKTPSKALSNQFSSPLKFNENSQFSDEQERKSTQSKNSKKDEQKKQKYSLKKDIMLFCVGVVTGGTLIGVVSKIFNK